MSTDPKGQLHSSLSSSQRMTQLMANRQSGQAISISEKIQSRKTKATAADSSGNKRQRTSKAKSQSSLFQSQTTSSVHSTTLTGQQPNFRICDVAPDGDCGFTSIGITRQQAVELLSQNVEQIKDIVQPMVQELLLLQAFKEHLAANGLKLLPMAILSYAKNTKVVLAAIRYDLSQHESNGWAHPSVLRAIAKIQNFRLKIWRLENGQLVEHKNEHFDYADYCPEDWIEGGQVTEIIYKNNDHFDRIEREANQVFIASDDDYQSGQEDISLDQQLEKFLTKLINRYNYSMALDVLHNNSNWEERETSWQHRRISRFNVSKQWMNEHVHHQVEFINPERLPRIGQYDCIEHIFGKLFQSLMRVNPEAGQEIYRTIPSCSPAHQVLNRKINHMDDDVLEEDGSQPSLITKGAIIAPTGYGKTYTYLYSVLASLNPEKPLALIVVPNVNLLEQTRNALIEHFNYPELNIGLIQGRESAVSREKRIILTTYQSFATDWFESKIDVSGLGIIIGDEAHNALSDNRNNHLESWQQSSLFFGYTATPETLSSNLEQKVPVLFKRDLLLAINEEALCPIISIQVRPDASRQKGDAGVLPASTPENEKNSSLTFEDLYKIIADIYMNQLNPVTNEHFHGEQAIVFCRTKKQANEFADFLNEKLSVLFKQIPKLQDIEVAKAIHSDTKNAGELIQQHIDRKFIFAVSVAKLREGYDNSYASLCFNLAGTGSEKNYIQGIGRIARRNPSNPDKIGIVFDFVYTLKHMQLVSLSELYGTWHAGINQEQEENIKNNLANSVNRKPVFDLGDITYYELAAEEETYAYNKQGEKVLVSALNQENFFQEQIVPHQQQISDLKKWLDEKILELMQKLQIGEQNQEQKKTTPYNIKKLNSLEQMSKALERLTHLSVDEKTSIHSMRMFAGNNQSTNGIAETFSSIFTSLEKLDRTPARKVANRKKGKARKKQNTYMKKNMFIFRDIETFLKLIRSKVENKINRILNSKARSTQQVRKYSRLIKQINTMDEWNACLKEYRAKNNTASLLESSLELSSDKIIHTAPQIKELIAEAINDEFRRSSSLNPRVFWAKKIIDSSFDSQWKLQWLRCLIKVSEGEEKRKVLHALFCLDLMEIPQELDLAQIEFKKLFEFSHYSDFEKSFNELYYVNLNNADVAWQLIRKIIDKQQFDQEFVQFLQVIFLERLSVNHLDYSQQQEKISKVNIAKIPELVNFIMGNVDNDFIAVMEDIIIRNFMIWHGVDNPSFMRSLNNFSLKDSIDSLINNQINRMEIVRNYLAAASNEHLETFVSHLLTTIIENCGLLMQKGSIREMTVIDALIPMLVSIAEQRPDILSIEKISKHLSNLEEIFNIRKMIPLLLEGKEYFQAFCKVFNIELNSENYTAGLFLDDVISFLKLQGALKKQGLRVLKPHFEKNFYQYNYYEYSKKVALVFGAALTLQLEEYDDWIGTRWLDRINKAELIKVMPRNFGANGKRKNDKFLYLIKQGYINSLEINYAWEEHENFNQFAKALLNLHSDEGCDFKLTDAQYHDYRKLFDESIPESAAVASEMPATSSSSLSIMRESPIPMIDNDFSGGLQHFSIFSNSNSSYANFLSDHEEELAFALLHDF